MPRYSVEFEGQWACFSSVVDAFVTSFMPRDDYDAWRTREYGSRCGTIESGNRMSMRDALMQISFNRDDNEICHCLREAGLINAEGEDAFTEGTP